MEPNVDTKFNFYPLKLKLCFFLVMEPPLVLKKSQKYFDFSGFRIRPFTKHDFVTNNSRVLVPKSRKRIYIKVIKEKKERKLMF
jgi:hypothetical protein